MVLRCLFISHAAEMLASFSWLIYVFWAFLIWVGIKLLLHREVHAGLKRNLRFCTHIITVEPSYDGENFLVHREEEWVATALLPVIVLVLATDVMFAVDAISASVVVSGDPYVVYTSNLLAIQGMRPLYFLLVRTLGMFRYLQAGLCIVLMYVGGQNADLPLRRCPHRGVAGRDRHRSGVFDRGFPPLPSSSQTGRRWRLFPLLRTGGSGRDQAA